MLVDRSARVWAMRPDTIAAQAAQFRAEAREGGRGLPAALAGGRRLEGSDFARVVDGVAIVPVYGPLMRSYSFWAWSYEEVERDLRLALADGDVRAVLLDIDSPGGLVSGCADCAGAIRAAVQDGAKPVEAFVGGLGASAAYWIASAAGLVTVGSGAVLGSVGSVIEYIDIEPMLEKMGARIVRVVAEQSPNKRLDPDSPEGRAELQALVDAAGAEFVAAVAANRGIGEAEVLARFGGGMVFDGAEAVRRGMADRRATLSETIAGLAGRGAGSAAAPAAAAQEKPMDWENLTLAALREHRADLVEAVAAEATTAATDAARAEGVAAERARMLAIDDIAVDGHEALVAAARKDGTAPEALAMQIVRAEKAAGSQHLTARAAGDAALDVPPAPPAARGAAPAADAPLDQRCKAAWDADAALRAEYGDDFKAFVAFEKAAAAGQARILRGRA